MDIIHNSYLLIPRDVINNVPCSWLNRPTHNYREHELFQEQTRIDEAAQDLHKKQKVPGPANTNKNKWSHLLMNVSMQVMLLFLADQP